MQKYFFSPLSSKKFSPFFLIPAFLITLSVNLFGQNVRLEIDSPFFYAGQPMEVKIVVENGKPDETPNTAILESQFDVSYLGTSRSVYTSIINGKSETVRAIIFNYRFTPKEEGSFTIPPIRVSVDGKSMFTDPVSGEVTQPEEVEGFDFKISPFRKRSTVFAGEPIILEFVLTAPAPVGNLSFSGKIFEENNNYQFDGFINPNKPEEWNITQRAFVDTKRQVINQNQFYITRILFQITPTSTGIVQLPSENLSFGAGLERDFFGEFLFTPMTLASNNLELTILDLPEEIKMSPNGIILSNGKLDCRAKVSSKKVLEGDPVTYTVEFSGIRNSNTINIPPFQNNKNFKNKLDKAFSIQQGGNLRKFEEDGQYKLEEILIPKRIGKTEKNESRIIEIPSLEFIYFNLQTEKIETVKTNPVKIEILPNFSQTLNLNDKEGIDPGSSQMESFDNQNNSETSFFPELTPDKIFKEINKKGVRKNSFSVYFIVIILLIIPPVFFLILKFKMRNVNTREGEILRESNRGIPEKTRSQRKKTAERWNKLIRKIPLKPEALEDFIKQESIVTPSSYKLIELIRILRYKGTTISQKETDELIFLSEKISREILAKKKAVKKGGKNQ